MGEMQVWADGVAGTVIGAAVWNVRTVLACDWSGGRVHAFAAENGALEPWGDGYSQPEGIALLPGDAALITERTGALLRQDLLNPGRAGATEIATGLGAPHQVVVTDDGTAAVLTDFAGGRLLRVALDTGAVEVLATGLGRPIGVALGPAGEAYLTEQVGGTLSRVDPDGSRTPVLTGLVSPFFLGWADAERTTLLVTERAPAHRVGLVDLTAAVPTVDRLLGRGITQPSAAIVVLDRLVVTGAGRLLSLDASNGLHGGVDVAVPAGPIWPGGWYDAAIDTRVTGYRRDELSISVEPPTVATLSEHPGAGTDPARPTVRLLAGGAAGDAEVIVRDAVTSAELGRAPIVVGFDDESPLDGPPLWVEHRTSPPPLLSTLSLERGVRDTGDLTPKDTAGGVLPNWRVLAVLVDTGDATWPTAVTPTTPGPTVADAQTTWRNVLTAANGVHTFYREMSGNRFGVQLVGGAVQGPVSLGKKWTDWFTMSGTQWIAKDDVLDRVVGDLQGKGIDWLAVDTVMLVVRSAAGGQLVWPRANDKGRTYKVKDLAGNDADVKLGKLAMPHDQTTAAGLGFANVEVTSHELGHTLGLDDLYMDKPSTGDTFTDEMRKRDLSTRELMGNESGMPHLCARHKLLLGFLDDGNVKKFSYDIDADDTFDLSPISAGLPAGGTWAAVELQVVPKVSWFFEFRAQVAGKQGDQTAFAGTGQVMGYDAWNYRKPPVVANTRRPIILLLDDGDGEGAVITAGQDYEVLDTDNPLDLSQFRLEVVSIAGGVAKVRVRVRPVQQPDPSIRNNQGEQGDYKSPDIEVRTAISDADPAFLNKPILGVPNRVVAKVTNIGDLPAPNVTVRFKALPFNTDDPESQRWEDLGDPVKHDIPAHTTVEFETGWNPPADRHYCIQARIDRYTRIPGAAADEPDVDNNLAQSNYFEIASKPSSPASREISYVDVHNPFDRPVSATVAVEQDSSVYRTFVDHRWVHLEPQQTRSVRMEVESKATSIWDAVERQYPDGRSWLRSWIDVPELGDTARTGSGVTLAVSTAVATDLRLVERNPGMLLIQVTSPAGAPPPHDGSVVLQAEYDDGETTFKRAEVQANGIAQLPVEPRSGVGRVYFSGTRGYAAGGPLELSLGD